jgi:hypothetical protein
LERPAAALVGARHDSRIKRFYERLPASGEPSKVALVARIRTLLATLNVVTRDRTFWRCPHALNPSLLQTGCFRILS